MEGSGGSEEDGRERGKGVEGSGERGWKGEGKAKVDGGMGKGTVGVMKGEWKEGEQREGIGVGKGTNGVKQGGGKKGKGGQGKRSRERQE